MARTQKAKPVWTEVIEPMIIEVDDKTDIRISMVENEKGDSVVGIRRWALYLKKDEREQGLTIEDIAETEGLRPTTDGVTMKLKFFTEFADNIQALRDYMEENELI